MRDQGEFMKIRAVQKTDKTQWAALRAALWPDSQDGYMAELDGFFSGQSSAVTQAFVLENDLQALIGFIEINIRQNVTGSQAETVPYIEGWFVVPAFRNLGLGEKLMYTAQNWAIEQGYSELASDVEIDNLGSIKAHRHFGFKETERVVCFIKQLQE